jgi:hypothetical protein
VKCEPPGDENAAKKLAHSNRRAPGKSCFKTPGFGRETAAFIDIRIVQKPSTKVLADKLTIDEIL